jgi:hypothetical protein
MNEAQALAVAEALRGETWNSGGGIWLVVLRRADGKIVVLSEEVAKVYDDDDAFDEDRSIAEFLLH